MKRFNRKRLTISLVLAVSVILLIIFVSMDVFTLSKYETQVTSQNTLRTAIYLVKDSYDTITVKLPDVIPDNGQYEYAFSISNYTATAHSDTNIKYRIHIRTTTNTHIEYKLFDTLDIENATPYMLSNSITQDSDGTYFRHILTDYKTMLYSQDKIDYYTLQFTFSDDYKDAMYSGLAEYIEINIESSQILQSDT